MKTITNAALAAMLVLLGSFTAASAATNYGSEHATPYVAAFAPIFGTSAFPRTGTMTLLVRDGTINGRYTGTSVGPDALDNRMLPVTGTVGGNNQYVWLVIGGAITLRGRMDPDGTISGTATEAGRLYDFIAKPRAAR